MSFRVDSPHLKVILPVSGKPVTLEGNVTGEVRQQGTVLEDQPHHLADPRGALQLNGRILPRWRLLVQACRPRATRKASCAHSWDELTVKGLTYANARIAKAEDGKVQVSGRFHVAFVPHQGKPLRQPFRQR